jgi:hypothetical protein
MGRLALVSVMALATAFSIISINLRDSGSEASRAQSQYIRYAVARNMARAAINMRLREIDKDTSGRTAILGTIQGQFNNATYKTISDTSTLDTLRIQSIGTYEGTDYQMRVKLLRFPKPFPEANAALGIRASDIDFKINGKALVDGRNYDASGTDTVGYGNKPGVTVMTKDDSLDVMEDSTKLFGNPRTKIDTTTADPSTYIKEYRENADYYYGPGDYNQSNITWGSPTNPVIVFCETADTTQTVRFSGTVKGWGILVVIGSLTATGNFSFYGMTIVYAANIKVDVTASGNATFVGGIVMAGGTKSTFTIHGQGTTPASVKYSSAALYNAKFIRKLLAYRVVEWWEQ